MENNTENTEDIANEKVTGKGAPWWFFLLLAVLSYLVMKYLGQFLFGQNSELSTTLNLLSKGAPIAAACFLLLAANALYKDDPPADTAEKEE